MSEERAGGRLAAVHFEDRALVERMRAGDEGAFETFAGRYLQALYRFTQARLGGDSDATREIVQTAMTRALSHLAAYRGEASLLTWLCSCCMNEIRMHLRRRRTAPAEVELAEDLEPSAGFPTSRSGDAEAALLAREEALRVHMALDGLPVRYARALEWKYVEKLPVKEIAGRLGLHPKAAESLLARARQGFRASYESARAAVEAPAAERPEEEDAFHGRARPAV